MTYTVKIYKIVCECCDKIYIGSTKQKRLCKRMWGHRADCKNEKRQNKLYLHMRGQGSNKFSIHLINTVEVNDMDEQRQIENRIIEEMDTILNGFNERRAYASVEVKKTQKKLSDQKYNKNNRDIINKRVKKYRENKPKSFICDKCNYSTSRKDTYDRHCKSMKHLKLINN